MSVLTIVCVGIIAGMIANSLDPERDSRDGTVTVLLGIGGATVATVFIRLFGFHIEGPVFGVVKAVLGSTAILLFYRSLLNAEHSTISTAEIKWEGLPIRLARWRALWMVHRQVKGDVR